jgi:hypothetical protein
MPRADYTPCAIQPGAGKACYEPAHVVLFAPAAMKFGGRTYNMGDKVMACLTHGGQIYDAIHGRPGWWLKHGTPEWLCSAAETNSLPAVRSPYQVASPAGNRAWSSRPPKYAPARR